MQSHKNRSSFQFFQLSNERGIVVLGCLFLALISAVGVFYFLNQIAEENLPEKERETIEKESPNKKKKTDRRKSKN